MTVTLRPVRAIDLVSFSVMLRRFFQEEGARPGSLAARFDLESVPDLARKRVENQKLHYYLIMNDGSLVGFLGYSQIHDDVWELLSIFVLPPQRNRGFARQALEVAMATMQDLGMVQLVAEIHVDNAPSLRLFSSLGSIQPVQTTYSITVQV